MQLERKRLEYRRNGTANLFVLLDAHPPWRTVKVTDTGAAHDFADCMRDLVDLRYPKAGLIRVVLDNLSTRSPGALYEAFPAPEPRRILRRLEFYFTPKHASWLNMVEIEIGILFDAVSVGIALALPGVDLGFQSSAIADTSDVYHSACPYQTTARLS